MNLNHLFYMKYTIRYSSIGSKNINELAGIQVKKSLGMEAEAVIKSRLV